LTYHAVNGLGGSRRAFRFGKRFKMEKRTSSLTFQQAHFAGPNTSFAGVRGNS
jgi:hypothetical protein